MALKNSIFDSKSEIKVLKQLQTTWTSKVGIYNHVPVSNVVDIPNLSGYKKSQIDYLRKTNFDFVIASEEDGNFGEPLLIIEFDGLVMAILLMESTNNSVKPKILTENGN
ncbi:DUF2726 domain-containing protein [Bacillus weihaiensis]|uniref:DUF2726 domain-containing protein n=1 Tax=Bacillus weihaiensis TaxID=1547283 RepID=UPI00235282E4|nr:DUF2726 domain-containing protein [Bacillus weihaiensis]